MAQNQGIDASGEEEKVMTLFPIFQDTRELIARFEEESGKIIRGGGG